MTVNKSLLDTDILSEILKGKNQTVAARATAYRAIFGRYTLSTITVMELVKGFHKLNRPDQVQRTLTALVSEELLSFDLESAIWAGRIYADLERSGQPIGRADPMIAGIALRHDLTLVSGNTAHYQRIQQLGYALKLDNWR